MSVSPIEFTPQPLVKIKEQNDIERMYTFTHKSSYNHTEDDNTNTEQKISKKNTMLMNKQSQLKQQTNWVIKLVQNIYFQIFITLLTIITLFLYDLKTIFLSKDQDFAVGVANLIFFSIFMVEIAMNIATQGYFCSFYFYLDIISTLTLLLDVDFITDVIFNQGGVSNFQLSSLVAKSKASRAAARAVRVVKIFRLARVAKLYKSTQRARQIKESRSEADDKKEMLEFQNKKIDSDQSRMQQIRDLNYNNYGLSVNVVKYQMQNDNIKQDEALSKLDENKSELNLKLSNSYVGLKKNSSQIKKSIEIDPVQMEPSEDELSKKQSNISRILSDDTIKRIIIIILLIMISIPLMDINNYVNVSTQWDFFIAFIPKMLYNPNLTIDQINQLVNTNMKQVGSTGIQAQLLCFDTPFNQISSCPITDFSNLRNNDIGFFLQNVNVSDVLTVRPKLTIKTNYNVNQSMSSVVLFMNYRKYNTIDASFSIATTIFICLTIIYLLTQFSNSVSELIITPIESMLQMIQSKNYTDQIVKDKQNKEEYETQMVQNAILKIKGLMQTIFGSIGNELVHNKMINNQNVNMDQSKTKGLFVFTRLELVNLPQIIDTLGEDTFGLLNQIAFIAQKAAYRYGGYCVKMVQNGFLIAYKIPWEYISKYNINETMDLRFFHKRYQEKENTQIKVACDYAFFTVLKIQARMWKEPKIAQFRKDQRFLNRFKKNTYNFDLKFSSNLGWAEMGIVGSSYKMDIIMLGSTLTQLNKLTKIKTGIKNSYVIAESLYANLSQYTKTKCRGFDLIAFQQNQKPEKLFFADMDTSNVSASSRGNEKQKKLSRPLQQKKVFNMQWIDHPQKYDSFFFIDNKSELKEILYIEKALGKQSTKKYNLAFEKYIKGEWQDCLQLLQYQKLSEDPLSLRLIAYIKNCKCKVSKHWQNQGRFFEQII